MNTAADVEDQIRGALELIRPAIQMDGGDIEFASFSDGIVTIEFRGACDGCPISPVTLKQGVEKILRERVPGVTGVVAIES